MDPAVLHLLSKEHDFITKHSIYKVGPLDSGTTINRQTGEPDTTHSHLFCIRF